MQFKSLATVSALSALASANFQNVTTITTDVTVTAFTTYCPLATTLTLTVCDDDNSNCHASEVTVSEPQTITITENCIIPSSIVTEDFTITSTVTCDNCSPLSQTAASVQEQEQEQEQETTIASVAPAAPIASQSEITSAYYNVTSYEGLGAKNMAGVAAGFVAVAAAML